MSAVLIAFLILSSAQFLIPAAAVEAARSDTRAEEFHPTIPQTWDGGAIQTLELPLADAKHSPVEVSWEYYYRIPVRPIYRSYPVYAPGHEPPGYWNWLRTQEPQVIWGVDSGGVSHAPALRTRSDCIRAGDLVFDAPIAYDTDPWGRSFVAVNDVRDPAWYIATQTPVGPNGVMPFARYVIRKKGLVELGQQACTMCHSRLMSDGTLIKGAQGNFPVGPAASLELQKLAGESGGRDVEGRDGLLERVRTVMRSSFDAPWLHPDPEGRIYSLSLAEVVETLKTIPPGVNHRSGSSLFHPVQISDLIGVKDRRYLDHTGAVEQRSIADLMRYAALNQDTKDLGRYGSFVPGGIDFKALPDPAARSRYSDEQLYALALFIYSLEPPRNPNLRDPLTAHGRQVFAREGCIRCHTPPLYTNNRLTPATGFTATPSAVEEYGVLLTSVGTDPSLALETRRGTGFYKVPSLRGLWYRGMFPHDGSCATLEDWFDPRRLSEDYVPTGFKGYRVHQRAVDGHRFGLGLSAEEKKALIAFLKTL